jgi:AraC family transcriptional activator of pobA
MTYDTLRENTFFPDNTFPINVFHNKPEEHNVLTLHWHEHLEMIYMVSGEAVFDVGNQSFNVAEGDILFVNGGQLHSGYSIHNYGVDYYAIVFHPSLLFNSIMGMHHTQTLEPFLKGDKYLPNLILSTDDNYPEIKRWIINAITEFEQQSIAYEINIKSYLQLVLVHLTRHQSQQETVSLNYIRQAEKLKPLFTYLEAAFTQKISVEQAAGLVNLSPHHFCKSFKKAMGRTFVEYLHIIRINEAERLLKKTNLSITHIAEQVGFCNINYFDKVYKKIKKYPPSNARKKEERSGSITG